VLWISAVLCACLDSVYLTTNKMITLVSQCRAIALCLLLGTLGCGRPSSTNSKVRSTSAPIDACSLLKNNEIEAVQKSSVKDSKSSVNTNNGFRVAQCFYTAQEFSRSVVITVTQRDPVHPGSRTPKEFWKRTFAEQSKEEEKERDKEEQTQAPTKIPGLGDDAYWTGARFGGALYALKDDIFIRISVGGGDTEEGKINNSKVLAQTALDRL
jgi:hypothetical protein